MSLISVLMLVFLGYVRSQSVLVTLSSPSFRQTSTTSTIATSRISFDTLSPAAFRTTTTSTLSPIKNECSADQKQVCKNGGQCISIENSIFFYCACTEGFVGIDCGSLTTQTTQTTVLTTITTTTTSLTDKTSAPSTRTTTRISSKIPCISQINICRNEALCFIVDENDLVCECSDGYFGKFCEFELAPTNQGSKILRF